MLRRITVASSKSSLITPSAASARPLFFTAGMRPMHTTGPLKYAIDADAEEMRARRRQQLEEEIKSGKLPEVNREEEFRPETIIKRGRETISSQETGFQTGAKKEDLPRASQEHNVEPKGASDDFAEENSGISDAQMSPDKQLHVHDAPPLKRGGMDDSIISDAIGGNEDGSVGSKMRGKMNASEHQQKYTARGNLNGMDRNNRNTSTSSSGEKYSSEGLSDIERSFTTEQLSSDLSGSKEEGKNLEWSSASASTNTSWIADNQQPYSTYADPKSEKRQERFSTRAPRPDASSTSSFPQDGFQKRSYATDSSKKEAIIGDSPIPASVSTSESSSKSFSSSSNTTGSSKRWPISTNIEMADFVGEKRMSDDDKGTQAKRNEARLGKGWQNRLRDNDQDFASGSAGAPARNMREKPVNYKRTYSTMSSRATQKSTTVANNDYSTDVKDLEEMVQPHMNWRVTSSQGTGAWHM